MRSSYKILNKEGVFFITSTIVDWLPVFTNENYFKILTDSFTFCQKNKSLKIYAYVILDNHFHMITSCEVLSNTIALLKMFTAN